MQIAGYIKTSLVEWPGKISSVIFVQGCNFKCPFCHNADLVDDKVGRFSRMDEERIIADLEKRKGWTEAVVVSGGEPTLQADLSRLLSGFKQMELLTMVHTNGTRPEVIEKLIKNKLVDYWCMDLKGDFENYNKFTNAQFPISNVQKSMKSIIGSGVEYEFRTTVVPGLHDLENLKKLAKQLQTTDYRLQTTVDCSRKTVDSPKWYLQQFRPLNCLDKKYLKIEPFPKDKMEEFQKELEKIIPQTFVRGV